MFVKSTQVQFENQFIKCNICNFFNEEIPVSLLGCDISTNNKQKSIEKKDTLNGAVECEFRVDSSCRSGTCYINCIEKLNALISEGPTFICVVCNRCLYKSNVKRVKENNYNDIFLLGNTGVVSFDKQCYICLTCHNSLKKTTMPYQAVANNFFLEGFPKDISTLNILEKELICQRLLLKKNSNNTKKTIS